MSKQLKLTIILGVFIVALGYAVIVSTRDITRQTHTSFLFNEIKKLHNQNPLLSPEGLIVIDVWTPLPPEKFQEIISQLPASGIDSKSCRFEKGQLLDAWGSPVRAEYQYDHFHIQLRFRSPGGDKVMDTADDVF